MTQRIMEICAEVQDYLNESYNYFAKKFCNIDEHVFDIKQEVIAKTGLFITKKRYGLRIINDAGRKVNKTHVKGLDTIRSNFAVAMKDCYQMYWMIYWQMFQRKRLMNEYHYLKEICTIYHMKLWQILSE